MKFNVYNNILKLYLKYNISNSLYINIKNIIY